MFIRQNQITVTIYYVSNTIYTYIYINQQLLKDFNFQNLLINTRCVIDVNKWLHLLQHNRMVPIKILACQVQSINHYKNVRTDQDFKFQKLLINMCSVIDVNKWLDLLHHDGMAPIKIKLHLYYFSVQSRNILAECQA